MSDDDAIFRGCPSHADYIAATGGEVVPGPPDVSDVIKHLSTETCDASWLKAVIERGAQAVFAADFSYIKPSTIRAKLEAISEAVKALSKAVGDETIVTLYPDLHTILALRLGITVEQCLWIFIKETDQLLRGMPKGQGRKPPVGDINSKLLCARIIIEAWRRTQGGADPGKRNKSALEACEARWRAADRKHGRPSAWEHHLRAALNPDCDPMVLELVAEVFSVGV